MTKVELLDINANSMVWHISRQDLEISCPMNFQWFPHYKQICTLETMDLHERNLNDQKLVLTNVSINALSDDRFEKKQAFSPSVQDYDYQESF